MELVILPKRCLVDENYGKWYEKCKNNAQDVGLMSAVTSDRNKTSNASKMSDRNKASNSPKMSDRVSQVKSMAKQLFDNEIELFQKKQHHNNPTNSSSSFDKNYNRSLLLSMISSGTYVDKIKSMIVLIKHNPIHDVKYLEELVKMSMKKSRRESIIAVDALKDIFISHLLPDRKLNSFNKWGFSYNNIAAESLQDSHQNNTKRLIQLNKSLIYALYEEKLIHIYDGYISSLVLHSKDTIPKVRSKVIGIMYDLLAEKPQGEQKLLTELVNKIGDSDRTTSSHATFMITKLLKIHNKMATNVVDNVKSLIMRNDVTARTRYLCICLINQIILNKDDCFLADNLILLYLNLFKSFSTNFKDLDNKMLTSLLTGINRALPFTSNNKNSTLDNYIDVLFKICHVGSFVVCTQSLLLLFQVVANGKSLLQDRYYQVLYETILRCPLHQGNTIMNVYLNLLFKSISQDSCSPRIIALVKRILQVSLHCAAPFVGMILMNFSSISEKLLSLKPVSTSDNPKLDPTDVKLHPNNLQLEFRKKLDRGLFDDDEEEYFEDADKGKSCNKKNIKPKNPRPHPPSHGFPPDDQHFDPYKRNPKFALADKTQLYELTLLKHYYQKTVSHFLEQLCKYHSIKYQGDPSTDFTSSKFFEKFSTKTPKKKVTDSVSIMTRKVQNNPRTIVTNCRVLDKPAKLLSPEEKIFYDYYQSKLTYSSKKTRKRWRGSIDSDDESHISSLYKDASDLEWTKLFHDNAKSNKKQNHSVHSSEEEYSVDESGDLSDITMDDFDYHKDNDDYNYDGDDEASELNFD